MLSTAQRAAFRAFVHRALNEASLDDVGVLPDVPLEAVEWTFQDHPHTVPRYASMRVVAAVPQGAEPEKLHALVAVPEGAFPDQLRTTLRQVYEVTISVQLSARLDDVNPEWTQAADVRLRRLSLWAGDEDVTQGLADAGLPVRRISEVRDLSRFNGSQWETRAVVDLVLAATPMVVVNPGAVESVAGTTETTNDDGAPAHVVPFQAEQ